MDGACLSNFRKQEKKLALESKLTLGRVDGSGDRKCYGESERSNIVVLRKAYGIWSGDNIPFESFSFFNHFKDFLKITKNCLVPPQPFSDA